MLLNIIFKKEINSKYQFSKIMGGFMAYAI
jgi:hypothetical protein